MKKFFMMIVLALVCAFTSYADDVKVDYTIGDSTDSYILVQADYVGLTNVTVKYYFTLNMDTTYTNIYFDTSSNHGNIYVHSIALYWGSSFYKKYNEPSKPITLNWIKNDTIADGIHFTSADTQDVIWMELNEDSTATTYYTRKYPYMSGIKFTNYSTGYGNIYMNFIKQTTDIVTNVDDINKDVIVIKRYDMSGRVVDDTYRGVVVEQLNNGKYRKTLKR